MLQSVMVDRQTFTVAKSDEGLGRLLVIPSSQAANFRQRTYSPARQVSAANARDTG